METTIHIGYHRTGSTLLQDRVFPTLPVNLFVKPGLRTLFDPDRFDPGAFVAELERESDGRIDPSRPTVISSELLSGTPEGGPEAHRLQIADRLAQAFPRAKILAVIRNQLDYVLSIYAYRVLLRGLESRSLDRYLADHEDVLLDALRYDTLIERYAARFGRDRVLVMPFERLAADPTGFVDTIVRFIGVEAPALEAARRVNESTRNGLIVGVNRALNLPLDRTLGALKRNRAITHDTYLRLARPYFVVKERAINPALRRLLGARGGKLALSTTWASRITAEVAGSNRRLAALTGTDLARYGYAV